MENKLPLIGVSADVKYIENRPYHAVAEKYLTAVSVAAGGAPLIIPALAGSIDPAALVSRLDGLFLTGSPSNVHPVHYDRAPSTEHEPYDQARDELTLQLIHAALQHGVPLLAVCRGFQELNVALGGSLHPALHKLEQRMDHRRPQHDDDDWDIQYGLRHEVRFITGGQFHQLAGTETIRVNSLHRQGIDDLAPGLTAEGLAEDGTIEAVSVRNARAFALGVQWHPEYKPLQNEFSTRLFRAFGEAARVRANPRLS
jgi:putative glutamine amidotransferase